MSRRWYRHEGRMVFIGWDRPLQRYFLTIADLCEHCDGTGEEPDSDYFCAVCGAEGVDVRHQYPSRRSPATLDEMASALANLNIPFPDYVRSDLEADSATDVGEIVHDYDQDPRRA